MASAARKSSASPKAPPLPILRTISRIRDGLSAFQRRLVPGHIALLDISTIGYLTQAVAAAAELGIADALADGPKQPPELARALNVDEAALRRLMRFLISFDVFGQRGDGGYRLTRVSESLRGDAEVSLRDLFLLLGSDLHRKHWSGLADCVRTGHWRWPEVEGMPFFEYAEAHPEVGQVFDAAMTSVSTLAVEPLQAAYDFGRYGSIVDIGGGRGSLLVDILRRHPSMRGTIFEMPRIAEGLAEELSAPGLTGRLTVESGDFFESVPKGGDAYLLKHIIHDWSDEAAERILRTVRASMESEARLLIIDIVLPENRRPHMGKLLDLEMLINTDGGRERTQTEFGNLLSRSGFTLTKVTPTAAPDSVIEAHPAW
ncbi:methyltransferase [Nocardia concava]|uniref:methyltransferase n=1 Tax=Nocardia concava TaxID=257281 RepID=UPI0002F23E8C|nr:methyltransferase [Nocardia concava]